MQDTGIVRRIDELGRVVIPKEIRRTLRIKEGNPIEIFTDKDQLILKKYSPMTAVLSCAQSVADSLDELLERDCIVTDNDKIICVSKGANKEFLDKNVSSELDKVMKDRRSVNVSRSDGGTVIPLYKGEETQTENQIVVPIIASGDCYGSVIVMNKEPAEKFDSSDVKSVRLATSILSKQFE